MRTSLAVDKTITLDINGSMRRIRLRATRHTPLIYTPRHGISLAEKTHHGAAVLAPGEDRCH